MNRKFLQLEEVIQIQKDLIEAFGGIHGIRDQGALESAVIRPQMGYYESLLEEAAALMESLANNHPFIDGNKRIAFFATDVFLRMNGYTIDCDNKKTHHLMMKLFDNHQFHFDALKNWLKDVVSEI